MSYLKNKPDVQIDNFPLLTTFLKGWVFMCRREKRERERDTEREIFFSLTKKIII